MARPPKCCGCEYCDWVNMTCKVYPEQIPINIQVEDKECKYYKLRIDDSISDSDLPVAVGR